MPREYTLAEAQALGVDNFYYNAEGKLYSRAEVPPVIYQVTGTDPVRRAIGQHQLITPIVNEAKPSSPKPGVDVVMGSADLAVQAFYGGETDAAKVDIGRILKGAGQLLFGGGQQGLGNIGQTISTNIASGAPGCANLILRPIEYARCVARAGAAGIGTTMSQGPIEFIRNPLAGPATAISQFVSGPQQTGTGMMGIPAVKPTQVQKARLVCPRGLVLGTDNLCYMKGTIPRKWRKWRPDRKPPVTAGDAKAIRRAAGAKRRVRRLAGEVGLSTHAKGVRHGSAKGRKR